jgi:hypothetical protein
MGFPIKALVEELDAYLESGHSLLMAA